MTLDVEVEGFSFDVRFRLAAVIFEGRPQNDLELNFSAWESAFLKHFRGISQASCVAGSAARADVSRKSQIGKMAEALLNDRKPMRPTLQLDFCGLIDLD